MADGSNAGDMLISFSDHSSRLGGECVPLAREHKKFHGLNRCGAPAAQGQTYPASPVMLVNPYAAGGPADSLARPIASAMSDILGQQVVILNKPGAATGIAAQYVARAQPDGLNLLLSTASAHIVTPALAPKIGYDGMRDFAFVAMIASVPNGFSASTFTPSSESSLTRSTKASG